ncbi:cytochrome c maturation protein CcmE [Lichenibacterium ramalinae]|uniref:Cytochrome c-type biogenesis protein CcmE n=1 Tax=Lichenibacterium ramalinae TaxID=2316527 RepID=A0A4Q2RCZ5_9HYPH|nr:cytochrome c maturation protein CcmE [Lichenibacterium ramalinae]RYB05585.1 cytochrome c maturation protein CcmE [Lichenibacterium ramalinae]
MRRKSRRLLLISSALAVAGFAAGLTLFALRDSVVFFYGPTEFAEKAPAPGTRLRIGGLVARGSLAHVGDATVEFAVTDNSRDVRVRYTGLLPDLFREGQGVVAEGVVSGPDRFIADSVLAKHDETYMPREVADALKQRGEWQRESASASVASPGPAAVAAAPTLR